MNNVANNNLNRLEQSYAANIGNNNGEQGNQPKALSEGAKRCVDKYREAYQRWGALADAVTDEGLELQAVTEGWENTTEEPWFIKPSAKQSVASFFAPIVNFCKGIANFFTLLIARQGSFPQYEARTSANFHNSIAAIFGGKTKIPWKVTWAMRTHGNGCSWCTLTNLDIKRVMKSVKNALAAAHGEENIKNALDEVEQDEKGKLNGNYHTYNSRDDIPTWVSSHRKLDEDSEEDEWD